MEELIIRQTILSKNKKSVVITLSDNTIWEFPMDVALKYSLQKGRTLTTQLLEEIIAEKRLYDAMMFALRKVNSSSKTKMQIKNLLLKEKYTEEETNYVIDTLEEKHIIDDNRYADNAVQYLKNKKMYGKLRIKMYLQHKGIEPDIIAQTIQNYFVDEEDDYVIAQRIFEKYKLKISRKSPMQRESYFVRALQRNGLSLSFASKFAKEAIRDGIVEENTKNN